MATEVRNDAGRMGADPLPATDEAVTVTPGPVSRRHSVQRLQVGFSGLAAMVLLVGLANIIMISAQRTEAEVVPEAAPTARVSKSTSSGRNPLADAGVVPDSTSSKSRSSSSDSDELDDESLSGL